MNIKFSITLLLFIFIGTLEFITGQNIYNSKNTTTIIRVLDKDSGEPLIGATIVFVRNIFNDSINNLNDSSVYNTLGTTTNDKGEATIVSRASDYTLQVSYIGYITKEFKVKANQEKAILIALEADNNILNEVIVTATESKGMSTSSKIDRQAMSHLQPSSFTDLLSLLPGSISSDPQMGVVNNIRLREAYSLSSDYAFNSLGTSFIIDGTPMSNDANLQSLNGSISTAKNSIATGIDMRSISTDNIENVEIIRGIPSAQYGDVSTGVVKIKRKDSETPFLFRFKADQYSKLFSMGKGIKIGINSNLNIDLDYIDSKSDPRDPYENFKRINSSIRYAQTKQINDKFILNWKSSFDFGGTFDNVKSDPEVDEKNDRFKSHDLRISVNNQLKLTIRNEVGLQNILLTPSFSLQLNKIKQTKDVYLNMPTAVPDSQIEGTHDAIYLPIHYLSNAQVDGKPFNAFLKLNSNWIAYIGSIKNLIALGADYRYEKNYGRGELYDVTRPPSPRSSSRPRAFKDIPSLQKISFYIDDDITIPFSNENNIEIQAGIRGIGLVGMNDKYKLNNKLYVDPRFNIMLDIINKWVKDSKMIIRIGGGWGILTKLPTISQLYPNLVYRDIEELNFYHNNPEYRRLVLRTHIYDPTNYNLEANRNNKWEIRTDFSWKSYNFSATYFKENTTSGFRNINNFKTLEYNQYDTSSINSNELTAPPRLEDLNYSEKIYLTTTSYVGNGSKQIKEGVEFQLSTPRYKYINTRITLSGAWFKTTYNSSTPTWYDPNIVIMGQRYPYLGYYDWKDKRVYSSFNTALMFDTHIKKLGLIFSTRIETRWMNISKSFAKNTVPQKYVGENGVILEYTEDDASDLILQHLKVKENTTMNSRIPFESLINFKANKTFGKILSISVFVNKLLSYTPSYKVNGLTIYRSVSPYFGMEVNVKF